MIHLYFIYVLLDVGIDLFIHTYTYAFILSSMLLLDVGVDLFVSRSFKAYIHTMMHLYFSLCTYY